MPRGNGIVALVFACLMVALCTRAQAEASPLVIGYERFHSDSPSVEGGRILFNELGCVNCHDHPTGLPARKGPVLGGVFQRIQPEWIQAFLKDPAAVKPGSNMPQMHLSDQEIEAVMHYFASLKPKDKIPKAFKFVNAERGKILYHEIGCVSCHEPEPGFEEDAEEVEMEVFHLARVPFPNFKEKYDIHSLSAYLFKPHDFSPKGRMPKFTLEKEDGGDLAAYLLDYANGDSTDYPSIQSFEFDASLVKEGEAILVSKNCFACHGISKKKSLPRKTLTRIRSATHASEHHPQYALSVIQQQSLDLFLVEGTKKVPVLTFLESLNCLACHDRESKGGPDATRYFSGDPDLGDAGRFPPSLTDAGRKFQRKWLVEAIDGRKQIRPYLRVQMPDFGDSTKGLAKLFFAEDRRPVSQKPRKINIEVGSELLGTQGGLNCITCHGWGDRRSLGIEAINLRDLHERLEADWLHDYLINPSAHRPNTLMPSFWPDGIASNQEILNGDTHAQINAIYSFSQYGEGPPEGFHDATAGEYEIVPVDRPVVQRSFMEGVGTHALLIGFPEGVHFAFDGKSGAPAIMWKGRFFDAYGTWFSRFPKFEKPLGESVIRWPEKVGSSDVRYQGYRIDKMGIPEFIVEFKGAAMYEKLYPANGDANVQSLQRTIRYTQERQLDDPRLQHPENVDVREIETGNHLTRSFIYQW